MNLFKMIGIPLALVLLVGEGCSCYFVYSIYKKANDQHITDTIRGINDNLMSKLNDTFNQVKHSLNRNAVILSEYQNRLPLAKYREFIHLKTMPNRASVQSYVYFSKVRNESLAEHIAFGKLHIQSNYTVWLFNLTNRNMSFDYAYPYYYPLDLSEPEVDNFQRIVGFDAYNLASTQPLITRALESEFSMSGRIFLVRNNVSMNYGTMISRLVYRSNTTDVMGINYAIVYFHQLIDGMFTSSKYTTQREYVDLFVFDVTAPELEAANQSLMYKDPGYPDLWFINQTVSSERSTSNRVSVMNRELVFMLVFKPALISSISKNEHILMLSLIISISIIVDLVIGTALVIVVQYQIRYKLEHDKLSVINHMLGYVNHEIRNPLNCVMGMLDHSIEALTKIAVDEAIISDLKTCFRASELINHIVNDILDIRRIECRNLIIIPSNVLLSDMEQHLKKLISPKLQEKQTIQFMVEFVDISPSATIRIDRDRLLQLLINLLTNSIKFTESGRIVLRFRLEGPWFKISVSDTGQGIPAHLQDKIFQPFGQVSALHSANRSESTSRYGGIGLGLYLCKMIVKSMNAEIGFKSPDPETGVGTVFTLTFEGSIILDRAIDIGMS